MLDLYFIVISALCTPKLRVMHELVDYTLNSCHIEFNSYNIIDLD